MQDRIAAAEAEQRRALLTEGDIGLQDLTGRADLLTEGDIGLNLTSPSTQAQAKMGSIPPELEQEPRLSADVLTEGDIGYEIPYDYPEYDEKGNIIKYTDTPPITTGGEGGLGGTGTNVPGTPIVPTGLTAAESAQAFEDAKAAEIAKVQAAAAERGAPFEHYYV